MKIFIILFVISLSSFASLVGDVSKVRNLPGYIDLTGQTPFYKGTVTSKLKKNRVQGVEKRSAAELVGMFFSNNYVDQLKLQQFTHQLEDFSANIRISECMTRLRKKIKSYDDCTGKIKDKKFLKKWQVNKFRLAIEFAIKNLNRAKKLSQNVTSENLNSYESAEFLESLFVAIEIFQGIRAEDEQRGVYSSAMHSILGGIDIVFDRNKIRSGRIEAANLLIPNDYSNPNNQMFFSHKQLKDFKEQGGDVSKLDPPSNGLWRKPKDSIKNYDTSNYNKEGLIQLNKLLPQGMPEKILDHDEVIDVVYKPHVIGGGITPKFNVFIGDSKWKIKFITNRHAFPRQKAFADSSVKYIWGSEVNTEPVVNNLAAALGFTIDPTYFKKKVRLYFEDEVYENGKFDQALEKLIDNLKERYVDITNVGPTFDVVKTDENGRKYVVMKSVTLESKSNEKSDMNIGFFVRDGLGKNLKREHRGFYNFLAWIGDIDPKDDNDKVKLVPYTKEDGSLDYKMMLSTSDMGASLGVGYPNVYNMKFVVKSRKDSNGETNFVQLRHYKIWNSNLTKAININDTKWFARRLAQLSEDQIYRAYRFAGMPDVVSRYYALLMLKKRNELLNALGMYGETFIDDGGDEFTIEKAPEFTGTIPGMEEFFSNGHLSDPENKLFDPSTEHWVRNWGVGWKNINKDVPQKTAFQVLKINFFESIFKLTYRQLFSRTLFTNHGINFKRVQVFDKTLGEACQNNCFFQGLEFGATDFIPIRFLVQNPDTTSDKPLWIVDMFRIGVFLGENGKYLQSLLGIDIPHSANIGVGTRLYKVVEVMKIHPVKQNNDYFKDLKSLAKVPKLLIKKYKQQMVDSMEAGDSLIVSNYIGQKAAFRIRPEAIPVMGLRVGGEVINMGRMTMTKGEDNKVLANWGRTGITRGGISLNALDVFINLPLVQANIEKHKKKDYTYQFDLSEKVEKNFVMKNLVSSIPKGIPDDYLLKERHFQKIESRFRATLFGLLGRRYYRRKIGNKVIDHENDIVNESKSFEIENETRVLVDIIEMRESVKSIAFLNADGKINLSVGLDAFHPAMKRAQFLKMVNKYQGFLPDDIIAFDPKYIRHYMGEVSLKSNMVLNNDALRTFFNRYNSKMVMCLDYAEFMNRATPSESCSFINNYVYPSENVFMRKFKNLWRRFRSAKKEFVDISSSSFSDAKYRSLKKLAALVMDRRSRLRTTEFILSNAKKKNYKRDVEINSSLFAFPGDNEQIKESEYKKGKLKKLKFDEIKIFADEIHEAVKLFFYDITSRVY